MDNPMESPTLLKDLLKSRRLELNLTQRDVARSMHMTSVDYIGMVESGTRRLDIERLPQLASVLRLSLPLLTEMTFRELYSKPDTQWIVDLLYGFDINTARKINQMSSEFKATVVEMIRVLYDQQIKYALKQA